MLKKITEWVNTLFNNKNVKIESEMTETFFIFYEDDGQWILFKKVETTLVNVLQEVYDYKQDKNYRLEKETIVGNQVINLNLNNGILVTE